MGAVSTPRLLVTGAGGFVGRHLVARASAEGWDVSVSRGDLCAAGTAERAVTSAQPGAVVHLAAPRLGAIDRPWDALTTEMTMLGNLVEAVREHAPTAVVLAVGSAAQYGAGLDRALTERDVIEPVSAYGARKLILERAFLSQPMAGALRTIWCRSFNHAGPGQGAETPIGSWSRQLVAAERAGGGTVRTGRLSVVRDLLDVRDVADAYLALIRCSEAAGVFNVCSGRPVVLHDVVKRLLAEAASPVDCEYDSALERAIDPPYIVGDPGRLQRLTGWRPAFTLEQTLHDTVVAMRADRDIGAAA